jgi:hypothetical protein
MSGVEKELLQISLSQLRSQKEDLRNFRNQAGFMSATSGIVATVFASLLPPFSAESFLSGSFILGYNIEAFLVLALFSLSVLFAFRVVICWGSVTFDLDIGSLTERYKASNSNDDFILEVAKEIDGHFLSNESTVDQARSDLFFSGFFAFSQVPMWLVLIV